MSLRHQGAARVLLMVIVFAMLSTAGGASADTGPTITGSRSPAANAFGWNNSNVFVSFSCSGGTGGIASCTGPSTLANEGAGQSVTGTAVDKAGNSSSTTVSGINIDKTLPSISGAATTSPNADGWYNGDVIVHWTCGDALSGIADCNADSTITGEGQGVGIAGAATDKAGNTTTVLAAGFNIDRTPPATTSDAPSGWRNDAVTVQLDASDNLSGVAATYWSLDNGPETAGTTISIAAEGDHTLAFYSTDIAGNKEDTIYENIGIDKTAPTITHAISPSPNADAWNNTLPVTVTFACGDAESGVAFCTPSKQVTGEGAGQVVNGAASDAVGNTATDAAVVNVDTTPPAITSDRSPLPNASGWNSSPVTVTFSCSDGLSGVSTCADPVTLSSEGAGQSATGTSTDFAGNQASTTLGGINIDTSPPTITGAATTPANGDGWYDGPVTIHWTCSDDVSGVAGCPADSVISADGANQSVSASVTDLAGNAASATVSGINVDSGAPTIDGAPTTGPNANGWYDGDVAVHWTCADSLSGIASCGPDGVVQGEGANLTASGTAVDRAGNQATASIDGINIDRTPPATVSDAPSGWRNGAVTVQLQPSDNLSGVASTLWTLDGGVQQSGTTVQIAGDGVHTLQFFSIDKAGNQETPITVQVQIDHQGPSISHAIDPAANGAGWNNSVPVTVTFTCTPHLAPVTSCTTPQQAGGEGAGQGFQGEATDAASNTVSDTAIVNVDLTAPTIAAHRSPAANANGWNNSAVSVTFDCADALSGVATCDGATTLGSEGAGQSVAGHVADVAGNTAGATVEDVNIDLTAPAISGAATSSPNAAGWYAGPVTIHWTCDDGLSGVASCPADTVISTDGPNQSATASVSDRAGNSASATVSGINIDSHAPDTVIDQHPAVHDPTNAARFTFHEVDPGASLPATFTCSLDGAPETGCTSPISFEKLASGNHSFAVRAIDEAGNQDPTPATFAWTLDSTAPLAVIDGPVAQVLMGTDLLDSPLVGRATDDVAGIASVTIEYRTAGNLVFTSDTTLVCTDDSRLTCAWRSIQAPRAATYAVTAVVRDRFGSVGRSKPLEVAVFRADHGMLELPAHQ